MEVTVEVEADQRAGWRTCQLCETKLEEAGLIDLVNAVNWRLGFNLKSLVSSLLVIWISVPCLCVLFKGLSDPHPHILAMAIGAAYVADFSNGHSKGVVHELVALVRREELCDEHNLRLCS